MLPYQGDNIEQATDTEYKEGFKCTPVDCESMVLASVRHGSLGRGVGLWKGRRELTFPSCSSHLNSMALILWAFVKLDVSDMCPSSRDRFVRMQVSFRRKIYEKTKHLFFFFTLICGYLV